MVGPVNPNTGHCSPGARATHLGRQQTCPYSILLVLHCSPRSSSIVACVFRHGRARSLLHLGRHIGEADLLVYRAAAACHRTEEAAELAPVPATVAPHPLRFEWASSLTLRQLASVDCSWNRQSRPCLDCKFFQL
jgi:hypothetical protein